MTSPTIPFDFIERGNELARSIEYFGATGDAELIRNLVDALDWIGNSDNWRVRLAPTIADDGQHVLTVITEE